MKLKTDKITEKLRTYLELIFWGKILRSAFLDLKKRYDRKVLYKVTVASTDNIYINLHRFILDIIPIDKQHSLILSTRSTQYSGQSPLKTWAKMLQKMGGLSSTSPTIEDKKIGSDKYYTLLSYNSNSVVPVEIGGYKIIVSLTSEIATEHGASFQKDTLTFTSQSPEGKQVVIDLCDDIARLYYEGDPKVSYWAGYGEWLVAGGVKPRSLDSVFLAKGQRDRIVNDIQNFIDAEEEYVRRGIPWRRGYLFHGDPGTGKTSLVNALSNHFGLDLNCISLGEITKDTKLLSAVGESGSKSFLLLEDIDIFNAATKREKDEKNEKDGISLSGLLNALDGVATPHGLITFMTTNDISVLDPALIRPGRIDLIEEFVLMPADEVADVFSYFYDTKYDFHPETFETISPALLLEILKSNMYNPDKALDIIMSYSSNSRT